MIQIHNVRLGFAANSSSTHYLITTGKKSRMKDKLGDYFGWDFFTASSKQVKSQYLASVLRVHLDRLVGRTVADDLIKAWLDVDMNDESLCLGVDHQSVPVLPTEWNGLGINKEFFNDYRDFILDKNIAIIGGNDNTSKTHPRTRKYKPFILPLIYDDPHLRLVARKDKVYDYWTLFNRNNGHKTRLTFDENQSEITRSSIPELVDIKITDYCNSGCGFCYMNSTPEGKHGDENYIRSLLYKLSELNVFEVALGGGEPTSHPQFLSILDSARMYGIVPNFTTKSLEWMKDDIRRKRILDNIGSFAFSVTNAKSVQELSHLMIKYDIPSDKVQVQVIDGVVTTYNFEHILQACSYHNITLVILGFKDVGRGTKFKKERSTEIKKNWWIDSIKKFRDAGIWCPIAIDTLIAKEFEKDLIAEGIDPILFSTEEGKYSCYIDAVERKMGPSSYMPDQMQPLSSNNDLIGIYRTF